MTRSGTQHAVGLDDLRAAAARIASHVHRTPVMTSRRLDAEVGSALFLKCENLQRAGSFKMRGASNAVMHLDDAAAARGVVTHSSGNFGQAMALAAAARGIPAHVVMPRNAPRVKQQAVAGYGGEIIFCEPTLTAREATAGEVVTRTGATFLHPYDQPDIIAGQGTCALELLDAVPDLDAVIAPVGGGGLVSGIAVAVHGLRPDVRVLGAEPLAADDAARSLATGTRQPPPEHPTTIADGLRTGLGACTWPIIQDYVERIFTVDECEIVSAMRLIWETTKLIVEPSAAVPLAALRTTAFRELDGIERIGVVLSGGNVDLEQLPWPTPAPTASASAPHR